MYAVFTRATRAHISPDNPLGFVPWDAILPMIEALKGRADGVVIQRSCGALARPRLVGARADGAPIDSMSVGSFDDYAYTEEDVMFFARIRAMGLALLLYTGFPVTGEAIAALREATKLGTVAVDMAGVNLATAVLLRIALDVVIEPWPLPYQACAWLTRDRPSYTMAAYWRRLVAANFLPDPGAFLAYNANEQGDNFYDAHEAARWTEAGYTVCAPGRMLLDGD